MRAVVTGAGGMLARALVPALRSQGHEVRPLTKADADVTRIDELREPIGAFRPDWVFHLAAFTNVGECESLKDYAMLVNGEGARNAAAAAAEVGAAIMMISSDYVFNGTASKPYREDAEPDPLCVYGESKLAGEKATRAANEARSVIVRTAWLYGHGGRNFPAAIFQQARAGKTLRVVKDQTGSPTWTEDLAPALVRLALSGQFGTFHCTNSGSCTWYDFAKYMIDKSGLDVAIEKIPSAQLGHPAVRRPVYSVLDNSRYQHVTGHKMASWQDAWDRYWPSLASQVA